MSANPVRVLVVDDSALMRKLIPQILATDDSIQVVGTAMDGNFGLKKIAELKPQGNGRPRHAERNHALPSDSGDCGQLA